MSVLTVSEMAFFIPLSLQSNPKSVAVKKETVKDEPLSPKSEPEALPQQGTKPRAKKGEGEKKVVIKKEFEKPGQTRDTPSEVGPLPKVLSSYACHVCLQLLCMIMIRFCALWVSQYLQ